MLGSLQLGLMRPVTSSAPLLLYTDIVDGSVSGGEGGAGHYLSLFGLNFGSFAALGTIAGARVFIGGAEVANYRVLDSAVTAANNAAFPAIQRIICQVGSAAVQALTLGTAYPVSVVVNGAASNANDEFGNALTFTPINAPTIFISENGTGTGTPTNPGAGNDANPGTLASPIQHIQTFSAGTFGSALTPNTSVSGGSSNGVQAGTQFVLRAGTYSSFNSFANRFATYFRITGCPPSTTPTGGSVGVNAGYIKVTAYPGPALGNACEVAFISNTGSGGFMGSDSARALESTPYGFVGYGKYICHSNLKITVSPSATDSSSGPIYQNNRADYWRNVNNDLSFPNTGHMLSGGISGNGVHQAQFGNYIHDVFCDSGLQNHGFYMDGDVVYTANTTLAYNYVTNVTGGSGIQFFNGVISGNDPNGNPGFVNNIIAFNWVDGVAKYGLNLADSTVSGKWYNNVVLNCTLYSVRLNTSESNLAITVMNNTLYNADPTGGGLQAMITNEANALSGFVEFINNIVVLGASRSSSAVSFYTDNATGTVFVWRNNLYYDPQGHVTTVPAGGNRAGEIYGNPLWTTPYTNFSLQAGSPAIGAGTTSTHLTITTDFAQRPQPRSGQANSSAGAYS